MNSTCLIITSCIYPFSSFVELKNPDEREAMHIFALEKWINESHFKSIIICDNSNYVYGNEFIKLALSKGKVLEILSFEGDKEKTLLYGKGYGEGEIMQYIYLKSDLILKHESFFKVTGKLFVSNSSAYSVKSNFDFMFSYPINFIFTRDDLDLVFTNFYYAKTKSYQLFLEKAYLKVRDDQGVFLEHVFAKVLKQLKKEKVQIGTLFPVPIIVGVGGSDGTAYVTNQTKNFIKNLLLQTSLIKKI